MKQSSTYSSEAQTSEWRILGQLGERNNAKVFLSENLADNKKYIMKLFSDYNESDLQEMNILSQINHESIIQCKAPISIANISFCGEEDRELFKANPFEKCYAIEYTLKGDILDLIQNIHVLPEIVSRSYVHQLVDALEYLHAQRIAHRDLKLESLLLDEHFCLKLANFEASEIIPEGKLSTGKIGTHSRYFAPEILLNSEYDAFSADMFALGVIIFELTSGVSPFNQVSVDEDEFYAFIQEERWDEFWAAHEEIYPTNPILRNPFLKELIERLLCPNPERRATISDVRGSKWMKLAKVDKLRVESWIVEIAKKQKSFTFYSSS